MDSLAAPLEVMASLGLLATFALTMALRRR